MKIWLGLYLPLLAIGCGSQPPPSDRAAAPAPMPTIPRAPFGKTADGQAVEAFTLKNANGVEVTAITYGGIITSLKVPDRNGASPPSCWASTRSTLP